MIRAFADATTEDVFHGDDTKAARKLAKTLWPLARRKLDLLNAAQALQDLRAPPGNRLEPLKGNLAGFYSLRINDQYRIIFTFADGVADEVQITDYLACFRVTDRRRTPVRYCSKSSFARQA
ncbi:MAG: type II toxin-antitoxin system RelE/ParE family toxin [Polyangiaceae bacterium]|nr:type II toxin-antitoxin system RelE/ParE family toxin [Polyangiaceae bacterium]